MDNKSKPTYNELEEQNKLLQIALQQKTKQDIYGQLFEKTPDALLILENGRFTDCNTAAINMLEYKSKFDLLNTTPAQISPKKQSDGSFSEEKSKKMIIQALKNGSNRFEWEHKKYTGEIFYVEVLLTTIHKYSEKSAIYVILRDISKRKNTSK